MTDTDRAELAPCPFCDYPAELIPVAAGNSVRFVAECINHGCHVRTPLFGSHAEAIAAWNTRQPAPASDDVVGLLRELREDLATAAKVSLADPCIILELRALCERAGYGNVMSSASALWRERLGEQAGGEFVSGPCRKTVENLIIRIDAALSKPETSAQAGAGARPPLCRNALRDAGKPYPRSGCDVCGKGGLLGCPYERRSDYQ